jgi:periplasmic copper chaperone A
MSRTARLVAAAAALLVALASPAAAHVTVQPPEVQAGSYAKLTFRVPNERDDAATTRLEVQLPTGIDGARLKPVPGWTGSVEGSTITWTGGRIEPGQFLEFDISVGPLPESAGALEFPAVQTYEDGEEVAWIESVTEGEEEPERPAPTLTLTTGDDEAPADADAEVEDAEPIASSAEDDGVDGAVVGAYVVGGLAVLLALAALVGGRRRNA